MLNDDLEVYDSCDLEKPLIPPRSHLYHLEPIGIGTPYVESLTSFLSIAILNVVLTNYLTLINTH